MSTESQRIITADEIRALELIGAAVPCYSGETIADQAKRLVDGYRVLRTGFANVRSLLSTNKDAHDLMMQPPTTEHERDRRAITALGGTRGT